MAKKISVISKPKYVVLDACIIQHHGNNTGLAAGIENSLNQALQEGYELSLSEYTMFELINGTIPDKEIERLSAINGLKMFHVRKKVFTVAARLKHFYELSGVTEGQISIGDRIVAATSMLLPGSLIYTANGADFPRPYFSEVRKSPISYKKANGNDAVMYDYFLAPDYSAITSAFYDWKSHKSKKPK